MRNTLFALGIVFPLLGASMLSMLLIERLLRSRYLGTRGRGSGPG